MKKRILLFALALSLCTFDASLLAQKKAYIPIQAGKDWLKQNGGSQYAWPIGVYASFRAQYFYKKGIGSVIGNQNVIVRFGFRSDGGRTLTAQVFDWEVWMSSQNTTDPTAAIASQSFKANLGPDAKIVVKRKKINVPAYTGTPDPAPFIAVPLDSPHVVHPSGKSLMIEIYGFAPGTSQVAMNHYCDGTSTTSVSGNSTAVALSAPAKPGCGGTWTEGVVPTSVLGKQFQGQFYAPGSASTTFSVAFMIIGPQLPTPAMLPGTQCYLNVTPVFVVAQTWQGAQTAQQTVNWGTIPNNAALLPLQLPVQYGTLDAAAKILLSQGIMVTIGDGSGTTAGASRLYYYDGSLTYQLTNDTPRYRVSNTYMPIFSIN